MPDLAQDPTTRDPITQDIAVTAVEPTDRAAMDAWFALARAAQTADRPADPPPCPVAHRAELTAPWPGTASRAWLATAGGDVLGVGALDLPLLDNTDNALAAVLVAPAHRGRGVGATLLARLAAEARAAGRSRLIGEAHAPLTGPSPGTAFAQARGAHLALLSVRRRLDVAAATAGGATAGGAAGASSGVYDLVQWTDGTPEEWLDDIARLSARMSTDAPLGELHWTPEHHDAQRVRDRDAMCDSRGLRVSVTAARAPDGRLVAFTEIAVATSTPWHGANWDTLVLPEHRGHGLGLRVKLANLALTGARFPGLRTVDTCNAASNSHMIAINDAIGFRPHDLLHEYELPLPGRR